MTLLIKHWHVWLATQATVAFLTVPRLKAPVSKYRDILLWSGSAPDNQCMAQVPPFLSTKKKPKLFLEQKGIDFKAWSSCTWEKIYHTVPKVALALLNTMAKSWHVSGMFLRYGGRSVADNVFSRTCTIWLIFFWQEVTGLYCFYKNYKQSISWPVVTVTRSYMCLWGRVSTALVRDSTNLEVNWLSTISDMALTNGTNEVDSQDKLVVSNCCIWTWIKITLVRWGN